MPVWTIHETDLFHPHQDPDDHWDLACQFSLAKMGCISLKGVMIDWPELGFGDPAVDAVAQMNWITGLTVPVGIGNRRNAQAPDETRGSVGMLLRTLEEAPEPVVIHIVGSCREISAAAKAHPELFREKVKAVYLNAGSAFPSDALEYNVLLDKEAYRNCFSLPCPLYWMPCFHAVTEPLTPAGADPTIDPYYGAYYTFRQSEILPELSDAVQNFFLHVLSRSSSNQWLKSLRAPVNPELRDYYGSLVRSMWCTGGFLHAAGLKAALNGDIVPLADPAQCAYDFVPIRATCDDACVVHWNTVDQATNQYIFCVNRPAEYAHSLTTAMKALLKTL